MVLNRLYAIEVCRNPLSKVWKYAANGIYGTRGWMQLVDPTTQSCRLYRLKMEAE